MIRKLCSAALAAVLLTGCFDTTTKLTGAESYGGTVKDGLYYQICQSGEGQGRFKRDSAMTLAPKALPDGRTGIEITGGETLLAEVQSLRPGVFLIGMMEDGKKQFENFIVFTADGVTQAFATVILPPAVEDRIMAADKTGDAAAIRAIVAAAVEARDYRMMTTYVAADLLHPTPDGTTPLPDLLGPVARAVGQPVPTCD